MSVRVYSYDKCSTCRNALRWLRDRGVSHEVLPIRDQPPTPDELQAMLRYLGGDVRRLFNSSGQEYRALGLADRLPDMKESEAIQLLTTNGKLVKRPFAIGKTSGVVGFKPDQWEKLVV
jgi:arsenate reductase